MFFSVSEPQREKSILKRALLFLYHDWIFPPTACDGLSFSLIMLWLFQTQVLLLKRPRDIQDTFFLFTAWRVFANDDVYYSFAFFSLSINFISFTTKVLSVCLRLHYSHILRIIKSIWFQMLSLFNACRSIYKISIISNAQRLQWITLTFTLTFSFS